MQKVLLRLYQWSIKSTLKISQTTNRNRRRDLTVGMRHKDMGLVVHARLTNKRERLTIKRLLAALTGKRSLHEEAF